MPLLPNACAADGLSLAADEAEGFFRVAQYGQVYTLQTRLNEMMLKVQLSQPALHAGEALVQSATGQNFVAADP